MISEIMVHLLKSPNAFVDITIDDMVSSTRFTSFKFWPSVVASFSGKAISLSSGGVPGSKTGRANESAFE